MYWKCMLLCLLANFLTACVTVADKVQAPSFDNMKAAKARLALALTYLQNDNLPKARENLELALSYAPSYDRALMSMAYYYQKVGEPSLAENMYQQALQSSPNHGDSLNNYAVFLCQQGRFQQAEERFHQAIKQADYYQVAASYENLALCALKSDNIPKAKKYFKKALSHQPDRPRSLLQLADIEIAMNETSQAEARLYHYIQKYGYNPISLDLLIKLEQKKDNSELVFKYRHLLKAQYPYSVQYQKYKDNEHRQEFKQHSRTAVGGG